MKIRRDTIGLFVRSRTYEIDKNAIAYRPGTFPGHSHAIDTGDGGLCGGESLKTKHMPDMPFVRMTLSDGSFVYWGSYGRAEGDYPEQAPLA